MVVPGPIELFVIAAILLLMIGIPVAVLVAVLVIVGRSKSSKDERDAGP